MLGIDRPFELSDPIFRSLSREEVYFDTQWCDTETQCTLGTCQVGDLVLLSNYGLKVFEDKFFEANMYPDAPMRIIKMIACRPKHLDDPPRCWCRCEHPSGHVVNCSLEHLSPFKVSTYA